MRPQRGAWQSVSCKGRRGRGGQTRCNHAALPPPPPPPPHTHTDRAGSQVEEPQSRKMSIPERILKPKETTCPATGGPPEGLAGWGRRRPRGRESSGETEGERGPPPGGAILTQEGVPYQSVGNGDSDTYTARASTQDSEGTFALKNCRHPGGDCGLEGSPGAWPGRKLRLRAHSKSRGELAARVTQEDARC